MSDLNVLTGEWSLIAWAFAWAIELPHTDNAKSDADRFLYDTSVCATSEFIPTGDSQLYISEDKRFSVNGLGQRNIASYDAEGIQINGVAEISGVLSEKSDIMHLLVSDLKEYDMPKAEYDIGRLRLDNGSTKIRDYIERKDKYLERVIRVVTDYSYGDCVVLRYERAG